MLRTLGLAALLIFVPRLAYAQSAEDIAPEKIAELISRLDADKFADREAASQQLRKLGEAALEPLREVAKSGKSAEVRQRASTVIEEITLVQLRRNAFKLQQVADLAREWDSDRPDLPKLEASLQRLLTILKVEADQERKLPVEFKEIGAAPPNPFRMGEVLSGDALEVAHLRKCIVVANTAVHVSHAHDCIIVAGMAADVSHAHNCIVIAGHTIRVAHDEGSVLLTGGGLDISFAAKTVMGAHQGVTVSHPRDAVFLNSKRKGRGIPPGHLSRIVQTPAVILDVKHSDNPLEDKIEITRIEQADSRQHFVLYRRKGSDFEFVARLNKPLLLPDGKPIPELEGWKLAFVGEEIAIFKKDDQAAIFETPQP